MIRTRAENLERHLLAALLVGWALISAGVWGYLGWRPVALLNGAALISLMGIKPLGALLWGGLLAAQLAEWQRRRMEGKD